jgi:hypothetical protein
VELHRRNSASFRLHRQTCAVVVVEGATIAPLHRSHQMLALGLLLNIAGVGLFCWLIFTLAVYALPFFVLCGRPHNTNWTKPLRGSDSWQPAVIFLHSR